MPSEEMGGKYEITGHLFSTGQEEEEELS